MNERPKAIVFDMDGLLFDTESLYCEALQVAAQELGHIVSKTDTLKLIGHPWDRSRQILHGHIGLGEDVDALIAAWYHHCEIKKHAIILKPGVISLLDFLDELSIPRAICTSSSHEDVAYNLRLHGITLRFDAIIASGDYLNSKPAPDPYLLASEKLGVVPQNCLALEDSPTGVRSATAAGMPTIMIPDLLPATDDERKICLAIADDLHAVRAFLS